MIVQDIRMQYYSSYELWKEHLAEIGSFRDRSATIKSLDGPQNMNSIFDVIENCTVAFDIGVKQRKAGMLMLTNE
jgi:hypothetical protein